MFYKNLDFLISFWFLALIVLTMSLPEEELHCVVCLSLPIAAVEVSCCNQVFCDACVRGLDACPHCRSCPLRSRPSIVVRRLVDRCQHLIIVLLHTTLFRVWQVAPTNVAEQMHFPLPVPIQFFTASGFAWSVTTAAQWWHAVCSAGTRRPAHAGRGTAARPAARSSAATSSSAWTTSCPNTGSSSGATSSASPAPVRLTSTHSINRLMYPIKLTLLYTCSVAYSSVPMDVK